MKKQTITPDMIKEATIAYVAEYGLENVTTKKVALSMGISEGTIFNNFPNKKALLTACLYHIDSQIDPVLKSVPFHGLNIQKNIQEMWYVYFNYLAAHGAYAKFYRQFRQSSYYDADAIEGQYQSFSFFSKFLQKNAKKLGFGSNIYWIYIVETTLNFAVHVADGDIPNTQKETERIYGLMSQGFLGGFKLRKKL